MCLSLSKTHQRENLNSSLLSLSGCLRKTRNSLRLCKWKSVCLRVCLCICVERSRSSKTISNQFARALKKNLGMIKASLVAALVFSKLAVCLCSLPPCDAEMHVAFLRRKEYIFYGVMNSGSTPRMHTNTHAGFNNASYLRLYSCFRRQKHFWLNGLGFWGLLSMTT